MQQDMDGMNLTSRGSKKTTDSAAAPATNGVGAEDSEQWEEGVATAPVISLAREKILEEVKAKEAGKPALSLVVVGKSNMTSVVQFQQSANLTPVAVLLRPRGRRQVDVDGPCSARAG